MVYDIFYISKSSIDTVDWNQFKKRVPTAVKVEYVKDIDDIKSISFTKFFWIVWNDLTVLENFKFDYRVPKWDEQYIHVFRNDEHFDGICLLNKSCNLSSREFFRRFYINKKEVDILASIPKKFIVEKMSKSYDDYLKIIETTSEEMFWIVPDDVIVSDDFKFDIYFTHNNEYDRNMNHVFLNGDSYDGVMLLSKNKVMSKREFDNRFPIERKEWPIVASRPKPYDKFIIDTFEEYEQALEKSSTFLFWGIPSNVEVLDDFKFDLYFPHDNQFDRNMNHVFKNLCNNVASYLGGIVLFSKNKKVSKKEITKKYLLEKKEHDVVASRYRYPRHVIKNYNKYLEIQQTEKQPMFWYIPADVEILDESIFDLYFPLDNGQFDYDREMIHVFLNDTEYTGIMLVPTSKVISKKEFESRHIVERKEWNVVASKPRLYDRFVIDTYEDYLDAKEKSITDMFWIIPKDVEVLNFDFNLRIPYWDHYNRHLNHVFQHKFRDELTYNGIALTSKNLTLTEKEIQYRFLVDKKEYDKIASQHRLYDIVFISYDEPNAEENYQRLLNRFPRTKRIHGVKGIHQAHIEAAKLCETEMFWAVDGDAIVSDEFNFDFAASRYEIDIVHVWKSINPINDLVYGYGGIKLLPRKMTIEMDMSKPDMTTSISSRFKAIPEISNITAFNTDPFSTWKSAFRECVKLASRTIDKQIDDETEYRLDIWCSIGEDRQFGQYAIEGAKMGKEYGTANKDNVDALKRINDFSWLKDQFDERYRTH